MKQGRDIEAPSQVLVPGDYYPGFFTGLRLGNIKKRMDGLDPANYLPDYRGISAKVTPGHVELTQCISAIEVHRTTVDLVVIHETDIYIAATRKVYLENQFSYERTYSSQHDSDNSLTLHNVRTALDSVHELQTSQPNNA